jgi:cytokinin dehydrogenase
VRAFYDSFESFTRDQELLVSMPELVDYVEGFMVLNEHSLLSSSVAFPVEVNFAPDFGSDGGGGGKKVYYCLEFAVHDFRQQDSAADHVSLLLPAATTQHAMLTSFTSNREKDHLSITEH